jgi:hypothetical protein
LQRGKPVNLAIEIWPTSIVVPKGYRIALTIRGKDYQWQATTGAKLSNFKNGLLGCGPFLHDDPRDRPQTLFAGTTTLHIDRDGSSHVLVPIIEAVSINRNNRSIGSKEETSGRDIMAISRRGFVTGVAGVGLSRIVAPNVARGAEGRSISVC